MILVRNRRTFKAEPGQKVLYIGRGSIFGNPFILGRDGPREEVILRYERMDNYWDLVRQLDELAPDVILCYCTPLRCHGDLLARDVAILRRSRLAK